MIIFVTVIIKATIMATIRFSLIGKNIYSEFTVSRNKKFRRKTGYSTNPEHWRTKKSTRKDKHGKYKRKIDLTRPIDVDSKKLKSKLDKLHDSILSQYNKDFSKGIEINSNWFKSVLDKYTNQEEKEEHYFTYQIQKAIDDAPNKKIPIRGGKYKIGLSKGRIKGIKQFKNIIESFQDEAYNGMQIKVTNISLETISDFEDWLFSKKYSHNYIGKQLANLKSILNGIKNVQININPSDIKVISESKEPDEIIYLSFEELKKIEEADLDSNYLENARKWLILGCYVGQRVSDLLRLSPKKIKVIQGKKAFQIRQQKTGKNVTIPILPEAEKIIKSGFPYKLSSTKLREYFKEVCRIAEINEPTVGRVKESKHGITTKGTFPKWKLIGTHVCRRSFASNFYGTIPTVVLKSITGHKKESTFLKYIGKSEQDVSMQMLNYIEKLPKIKTMEVIKNERVAR